jgi:hypothetical protein
MLIKFKARESLFDYDELRKDLLNYHASNPTTLEQLARNINININTLRRFICGQTKPHHYSMFKIINFLKDHYDLLGDNYGTK